jgi:uncharacterized SAM-binding protein YcdF (DUF218 family)
MAWGLLAPSQVLIGAAIAGTVLVWLGRARAGRMLGACATIGLLLFGLLPGSRFLAGPLEGRFREREVPERIAGIILLAGSERPAQSESYGEPQIGSSGSRYVATLLLAERHPEATVVFSGGELHAPGRGALGTQSDVAREILNGAGMAANRLRFDFKSDDTCAHAENVRALVRPRPGDPWIVVSSAMHMPRVIACFRAAGWTDVIPYATDYRVVQGGWDIGSFRIVTNLEILDLAAHEWLGLVYYRLSGRTRELFPAPDRYAATERASAAPVRD